MRTFICLTLLYFTAFSPASAQEPTLNTSRGDAMIAKYFAQQTSAIEDRWLAGIETKEDWLTQREKHLTQLKDMLGLNPFPKKTPLNAVITGTTKHESFRVEKIHFQSRPGLYVTGNLYVPHEIDNKLPAILYVCGHGQVKINGVSYGAKAHYQHHGAWFARNGYVCLTIDTLQLGEIEGIHHGTYRYDKWWWLNRGYTPAGVEAWNCIRALDYLQSRPEVDGDRLGVTGRSGGGAYSWWIAALDERIKVAVPVAGTTDLRNHVVDGTVEGHCDCMFMVNTYQWDYPMVAALVAPRPLLLSNTDNDRIFPLDGVYRTFRKVSQVYDLLDASDKFSLHITSGPHQDTQELRVHAFRWFNYYLKDGQTDLLRNQADKFFEPADLKVFDKLPTDQVNTEISESFVPTAVAPEVVTSQQELAQITKSLKQSLLEKSFAAWPKNSATLQPQRATDSYAEGLVMSVYVYQSQAAIPLNLYVVHDKKLTQAKTCELSVLNQDGWNDFLSLYRDAFGDRDALRGEHFVEQDASSQDHFEKLQQRLLKNSVMMAYVAPRGVGPTIWDQSVKKQVQHQRRFYLLGESLESMQVWDVRQAIKAITQVTGFNKETRTTLHATGRMAGVSLYATLFQNGVAELHLTKLPSTHREGPYFFNVSRICDIPQIALSVASQTPLFLYDVDDDKFKHTTDSARHMNWNQPRLLITTTK